MASTAAADEQYLSYKHDAHLQALQVSINAILSHHGTPWQLPGKQGLTFRVSRACGQELHQLEQERDAHTAQHYPLVWAVLEPYLQGHKAYILDLN